MKVFNLHEYDCSAEKVMKEVGLMCKLQHENVCRYYNSCQLSGIIYIRMEVCDIDLPTWIKRRNVLLFSAGKSAKKERYDTHLLDCWILSDISSKDNASLSARNASSSQQMWFKFIKAQGTNEFLKGLLKGVNYLHVCGLAHQDLHMKNVLVKFSELGNTVYAKICDFGLASIKTDVVKSVVENFRHDLENIGKIMVWMYYPLTEGITTDLLSKLQKSSKNHRKELNSEFHEMWPDQASWIKRLLSSDENENKPTASEMLQEGMRSKSETFPSDEYRLGVMVEYVITEKC